jgi:hypothetical protein
MVEGESASADRPMAGRVSALVTTAPLLVTLAASTWIAVGWAIGASPFWRDPGLTMSEAAALSNAGEIVRLITVERRDPNRAWPVREGILGAAQTLTPLEAAVAIRRAELFPVLLQYGATVPSAGPARTTLICRAAAFTEPEIIDRLVATGDGSDPRSSCEGVLP